MQIFDFKSGSPHPCTALQLSAYALLASEGIDKEGNRFMDRSNKNAIEVRLFHPLYKFAGTADMIIDDGDKAIKLYAVYLKDTGKYSLVDHTKDLRRNKAIFLSFLTVYKFKKERGLL